MTLREEARRAAAQTPPAGPGDTAESVRAANDAHVEQVAEQTQARLAAEVPNGRVIGQDAERSEPAEPVTPVRTGTPLRLTRQQYEALLRPLAGNRVRQKQGQSHLEAWDIRRTLTRIFGFGGFRIETISLDLIHEKVIPGNGDRFKHTVVYMAQVRLTVFNPDGSIGAVFEDAATGDGTNMPSYQGAADFAVKTALSQALKRCAVNLGDQFGMSLYNGGSVDPVVIGTLRPPPDAGVSVSTSSVAAVVTSAPVQGEIEAVPSDDDDGPAESAAEALPRPEELRDEALEPDTSLARLSAINLMVHPKRGSHPQMGHVAVVNENGEQEPLASIIYRKIQERKQRGEKE